MKTLVQNSDLQNRTSFFTRMGRMLPVFFWLLFLVAGASAQTQSKLWTLSPNKVSFPAGPTASSLPTYDYAGQSADFSQNSMYDANGDLLFFVIDGMVYDGDGYLIDEIWGLYDPYPSVLNIYKLTGQTEWVIVPVPGECRQYYLICNQLIQTAGSRVRRGSGTYYIKLDMNAPNINYPGRKGALEMNPDWGQALATLLVNHYTGPARECYTYHLAATKLRQPENNHLLFVNDCSNFFRFRIENSGIYDDSYTQPLTSTDAGWVRSESEIVELHDGTWRLAIPLSGGGTWWPRVEIFHLDAGGDVISSYWIQTKFTSGSGYEGLRGLEFSPDGNTLYLTHNQAPHIRYIDVGINSTSMQAVSQATHTADFQYSQIEVGYDGKLYFAAHNRLATLADPNNPASAWNNNALSISVPLTNGQWGDEVEKLRVLPDQLDGEDYETHLYATSECCELAQDYTTDNFVVGASATWSPGYFNNPFFSAGTITVRNTLTIPAGIQLTISGMTLKMGPGARIFIKGSNGAADAARLTLDNTTITANDACGPTSMWKGIVLEGDRYATQNLADQGSLTIQNNSVLEHAYDAVVVKGINPDGSTDWNKTGGIIKASDSYFLNNRRAVEFMSYGDAGNINSISRFDRCVFETNQLLRDQDVFPGNVNIAAFVTLWNIDGVRFRDNVFHNTFMNALNGDPAGYGIKSAEAIYHVQKGASTLSTGNRFENLVIGIDVNRTAAMTSGIQHFTDNSFVNNRYGIKINGDGAGYSIRRNSFTKSSLPAATLSSPTLGIYSHSAQRMYIVDNSFENFTYGVLIKNSGGADDFTTLVQSNDFTNNFRGLQTQYTNKNMKVKCNEFSNPGGVAQMFWGNWGPMADQGNCSSISSPAGNRFFGVPTHSQIYATTAYPFDYYHHNGLVPVYIIPTLYFSGNPTLMPCGAYDWDQTAACDNIWQDGVATPAKPVLISGLIFAQQYQRARFVLNESAADGSLDHGYREYFSLVLSILESRRSLAEMNPNEMKILEGISEGHSGASANARALLRFFTGRDYEIEIIEAEQQVTDVNESTDDKTSALGVNYPNPASIETRIPYNVLAANARLQISDLFGRTIHEQNVTPGKGEALVSLKDFGEGVYLCRLIADGRELASRMITVQR